MTPSEILAMPARVLTQAQRQQYFDDGYVCVEALIPSDATRRMQRAMSELVDRGRHLSASEGDYVLETSHTSQQPRLRRVYRAADLHPTFKDVAFASVVGDAVADLLGPDIKFRESYINFKWARGGDPVKWHQDVPFFPHTNLSLVTTLTYLEDCDLDQGPLMIVPRSHKGELFEHYDNEGQWAACISDRDLARVPTDGAVNLTGSAGTVVLMDSRAIHGSGRNDSDRGRPLLINGYAAADAFPYSLQDPSKTSTYEGTIVRGKPAKYSRHDAVRLRVPPDWSGGYKSIFEDQQGEKRSTRNLY